MLGKKARVMVRVRTLEALSVDQNIIVMWNPEVHFRCTTVIEDYSMILLSRKRLVL